MKSEELELLEKLKCPEWRLNNLYYITDVHGNKIKFKMNWAQRHLFENLHFFNVILKARQLGMSTFILIYLLDSCLFTENHAAGVIAHTRDDSENLFKNKVKFAYDNLPDWLRKIKGSTQDTARRLEFDNGSSITVGTSLRGGTFQKLHVSEYGKIAARYPDKAKEVKTGALNTVHVGQQIFVESTAEGNQGEFYELCARALRLHHEKALLTPLDPRLHFYPWYMHPDYRMDADVSISDEQNEYFAGLPLKLDAGQKAWYVKKSEQQGEDMKREYPSSPRESFEQSMEGAIYNREMALVRKKGGIGNYPHEPSKPVYTFWDLGKGSDYTSIWFFQHMGNEYRFINYHESHNEGWAYYANLLNSFGYVYKEHVLPHDANTKIAGKQMSTIKKMLHELGVRPIRVVPRTNSVWNDIKGECRNVLPRCTFDEGSCKEGVRHLDNYRRDWDDKLGQWKDKPRHDESSHGADAFRTFAMGFVERHEEFIDYNAAQEYAIIDYDILDY